VSPGRQHRLAALHRRDGKPRLPSAGSRRSARQSQFRLARPRAAVCQAGIITAFPVRQDEVRLSTSNENKDVKAPSNVQPE
jgi:hypothetical protein